jgi:hypothetical protein
MIHNFTTEFGLSVTIQFHTERKGLFKPEASYKCEGKDGELIAEGNLWIDDVEKSVIVYDGLMPNAVRMALANIGYWINEKSVLQD